ncbi:MAG: hypothetical protein UY06_C0049G0004 [Candidatus Amesbacteria bacterium GW2011_GWA2_47_70]|nr:MAG: hypothetical protein UY06_C0049G0004 [Candidatus Amesbacteria bacterium GW2011_GWA2_47_70]
MTKHPRNMGNIPLPKGSTILIDTNFFLDLFSHKENYKGFFDTALENEVVFVSCDFVRCEFVRTKEKSKLIDKNNLFIEIVGTPLPMDKQISELIIPTLEQYAQEIEGVELTDIILGCFLKRYQRLYLLTRNHKDFPTRIFERSHIFSIEHGRDVKTYALYQYRTKEKEVEAEVMPF